ncbi:uncharacterized protein LOC117181463 [Belonocnema kinseyi]|uniref:uncharacterized protein LOC117181463 n=1 Tax=Belonocnema kinseyi TaxID=2817044 RepID=UPI00143D51B1|nr:uncharacterized protein LOC117181463 [Belonocnema kinseyi]
MERIRSSTDQGYYLPHQAVVRESSLTTKLRVVFDASAKTTTGISLNDILMVGPTIQDGIFTLIVRFRQHPFVLSSDIEKMYRQFWVYPEDRKYQKILWRYSTDEPLRTYQLKTVTYGTSAAPFLAVRCLKKLAEDEGSLFRITAKALKNDVYVDDLLTGAGSVKDAKQLRDQLKRLAKRGGLRLCKWISNSQEVINDLPDCSNQTSLKLDPDHATKTLGVSWNSQEDMLIFEVDSVPEQELISKRVMLSQIAKLYDPLGLLAPVIIYAKIKMQQLWKTTTKWDDLVPPEILSPWRQYQKQLHLLSHWKIPRSVQDPGADELQLHGFADAERAYGACIYLRSTRGDEYHSTLLCAKSRVAPIKNLSMPRLELCATVLLANLYKNVTNSFSLKVSKTGFWSDSTITLNRISPSPHEYKTFVANRIAEIQDLTPVTSWKYVSSKENPADFISRGQLPQEFIHNTHWKNGPEWVTKAESNWHNHSPENIDDLENERKGNTVLTAVTGKHKFDLWTLFSSLPKLLRVTAYCFRFI